MKPYQSSLGTIIQINAKLLYATVLVFAAYYVWPSNIKWWCFGFITICAGGAAIGLLVNVIKLAMALYARNWVAEDYLKQGNKPKSSDLASTDDLDSAGMR